MNDEARIATGPAGSATFRGFLFSDVRGFTAFAERHGNAAAAAMVRRFLELARKAIARYEGAEVKTEGDAIHAVFPSASSAVLCGLDIVDAAAALNASKPDWPLGLGVGVHAGEAVETAEGYIGTAVNVAARLCAAARPGEVLVAATTKSITQGSIPVGFIPRGRRRLKGIRERVEVYAVSRDPTAIVPQPIPRPAVLAGAGFGFAIVLAIVALAGWQVLSHPGAGPSPSAQGPRPVAIGPLPIGRYASQAFQPAITFDITDTGWTAHRDVPGLLGLIREEGPRGSLDFARVQEVIANPCVQGGEGATGPAVADVIGQLQALGHLEVSTPETVQVGGSAGRRVDVTVAESALAACGGLVGAGVGVFVAGDEAWSATPGERFRLVAVDNGGAAVTIVVALDWTQTHSVQELEAMFQLGQHILDGVAF